MTGRISAGLAAAPATKKVLCPVLVPAKISARSRPLCDSIEGEWMASLTEFQEVCERTLEELLATCGRKLERRQVVQGETQTYLTARIEGTGLHVWIYEDEAMFSGEGLYCRYKTPDCDSPGDLIGALSAACRRSCRDHRSPRA